MTIRPAIAADAEVMSALHIRCFDDAGWSAEQIIGSLDLLTTRGWSAWDGDALSGFILCQTLPEQAELLTLAVDPAAQRQGHGAALLQAAFTGLQGRCAQLWLEVAVDNHTACRLYEREGFAVTGRRRNYYQRETGAVDALLMARKL